MDTLVQARGREGTSTCLHDRRVRRGPAQFLGLQIILTAIANFTVGVLVSLFVYAFQLPALLASYGASLPSALLFFAVSLVAAASVVLGFILCLCGTGLTVIYTTGWLVFNRMQRIADAEQRAARLRDHAD